MTSRTGKPPIAILKPLRMLYNVDRNRMMMGRDLELPRDFRTQRPKYHRNVGDAASAASTSPEGQSRNILPRKSP